MVKSGVKPKIETITLSQWSIANLVILYKLLGEGKLLDQGVIDYLSYTTKVYQLTQRYENVSVYLYDREYRKMQAAHNFRWGTDIPHLHTMQLTPRAPRNNTRVPPGNKSAHRVAPAGPVAADGRPICKMCTVAAVTRIVNSCMRVRTKGALKITQPSHISRIKPVTILDRPFLR